MKKDLVVRIGGEAGLGLAAAADILAKVFVRLGYHIYSSKEYASQIKGGHNYHTLRITSKNISADVNEVEVLFAFSKDTIAKHYEFMREKGVIFVDDSFNVNVEDNKNLVLIKIPVKKLEQELQEKGIINALFLGAFVKYFGIKSSILEEAIKEFFKEKAGQGERNSKAAREAEKLVEKAEEIEIRNNKFDFWSGNDAITLGALDAGLRFHVQYPMTPVSAILHNLAKEAEKNKELKIIQAEDEIAVINMAIGASYAGARAMCASSGGGFALMIEAMGLASMAEVPLVVIEGQRPGPSTGLPTKTEQGDLKFVLYSGTGDFPHVVLAPANIEECYTETKRAFYLAEKYQLPVLVLIDKQLAESFKTLSFHDESRKLSIDFSKKYGIKTKLEDKDLRNGLFKRYQVENDGVYERTLPGMKNGFYTCAGDEHDEIGEIIEEQEIRIKMMQRRMNKLDYIGKELPLQEIYGDKNAEITVVGWGSTSGAIIEAVERLQKEGKSINAFIVKYMRPFMTTEVEEVLGRAKRLILAENNYSAQLGGLIQEKTTIRFEEKILRYDGKNFSVDELYEELKKKC